MLLSSNKVKSILEKILPISSKSDGDVVMQDVVEIINRELKFDLTCIFMFSRDMSVALLRAGSGEQGKYMVAQKHKIHLHESSVFTLVAQNEIRVVDGWSGRIYGCIVPDVIRLDTSLPLRLLSESAVLHSQNAPSFVSARLPDPLWEIALPLRLKDQVFGSLWIRSLEFSGFVVDDCGSLQWLTDNISAILFKDLE